MDISLSLLCLSHFFFLLVTTSDWCVQFTLGCLCTYGRQKNVCPTFNICICLVQLACPSFACMFNFTVSKMCGVILLWGHFFLSLHPPLSIRRILMIHTSDAIWFIDCSTPWEAASATIQIISLTFFLSNPFSHRWLRLKVTFAPLPSFFLTRYPLGQMVDQVLYFPSFSAPVLSVWTIGVRQWRAMVTHACKTNDPLMVWLTVAKCLCVLVCQLTFGDGKITSDNET